jgi:hypothetical protein
MKPQLMSVRPGTSVWSERVLQKIPQFAPLGRWAETAVGPARNSTEYNLMPLGRVSAVIRLRRPVVRQTPARLPFRWPDRIACAFSSPAGLFIISIGKNQAKFRDSFIPNLGATRELHGRTALTNLQSALLVGGD